MGGRLFIYEPQQVRPQQVAHEEKGRTGEVKTSPPAAVDQVIAEKGDTEYGKEGDKYRHESSCLKSLVQVNMPPAALPQPTFCLYLKRGVAKQILTYGIRRRHCFLNTRF